MAGREGQRKEGRWRRGGKEGRDKLEMVFRAGCGKWIFLHKAAVKPFPTCPALLCRPSASAPSFLCPSRPSCPAMLWIVKIDFWVEK